MPFAAMPWYELEETQSAQQTLWQVLARHMSEAGIGGVPAELARDRSVGEILTNPGLIFGQCCGYDIVYGFADHLVPVATPRYSASGCAGPTYRSFIVVREDMGVERLEDLRGMSAAINGFNSHSGCNALRSVVAPLCENGHFFGRVFVSGGHLRSLAMLCDGRVNVMAMDCVLHALLTKHRPQALDNTRILTQTEAVPAPPFVTSSVHRALRARIAEALSAALNDPDSARARDVMLLDGAEVLDTRDYAPIVEMEGKALGHGYAELHAVSDVIAEGRLEIGAS